MIPKTVFIKMSAAVCDLCSWENWGLVCVCWGGVSAEAAKSEADAGSSALCTSCAPYPVSRCSRTGASYKNNRGDKCENNSPGKIRLHTSLISMSFTELRSRRTHFKLSIRNHTRLVYNREMKR